MEHSFILLLPYAINLNLERYIIGFSKVVLPPPPVKLGLLGINWYTIFKLMMCGFFLDQMPKGDEASLKSIRVNSKGRLGNPSYPQKIDRV